MFQSFYKIQSVEQLNPTTFSFVVDCKKYNNIFAACKILRACGGI